MQLDKESLYMKTKLKMIILVFKGTFYSGMSYCQYGDAVFPVIKGYGGIYNIPFATINAEPDLKYKVAIEVKMGSTDPAEINPALNNIARLMNLHVLGGAKEENLEVVAIVHGLATTSVITDEAYKKRFEVSNPNTNLINRLKSAGVKIILCGQSMRARNVDQDELADGVEVAISMLTAFTTYQLNGFAALQF